MHSAKARRTCTGSQRRIGRRTQRERRSEGHDAGYILIRHVAINEQGVGDVPWMSQVLAWGRAGAGALAPLAFLGATGLVLGHRLVLGHCLVLGPRLGHRLVLVYHGERA